MQSCLENLKKDDVLFYSRLHDEKTMRVVFVRFNNYNSQIIYIIDCGIIKYINIKQCNIIKIIKYKNEKLF